MGIHGDLTDLAELKRLAEAASVESPGAPWAYEPHGDTGEYGVGVLVNEQGNYVEGRQGSCEMSVVVPVAPEVSSEVFAAFIAAANPSAVLALIAANEVLRTSAERYWWLRENAQQDVDGWRNEVPVLVHALSHVTGWRNRIDESVDAAMTAGDRS